MSLSFAVVNMDLLRGAAFGKINGSIFDVVEGRGCGLVGLGFWNFFVNGIGALEAFGLDISFIL